MAPQTSEFTDQHVHFRCFLHPKSSPTYTRIIYDSMDNGTYFPPDLYTERLIHEYIRYHLLCHFDDKLLENFRFDLCPSGFQWHLRDKTSICVP